MNETKSLKTSKPVKKAVAKPARGHMQAQVLAYMCRGLMVGAFLPGQVMSLRKLAAAIGTSPTPVREVLSGLIASKALEETSNGSVRVPQLTRDRLRDLFSVRELLEGEAAGRAAKKATPALVAELSSINRNLLRAIAKREILDCLAFNQQFHFALYKSAPSEALMPLIEMLWLQFGPTMYLSLLVPSMPWDATHHRAIIEALKDRNPGAAKRAVVDDIQGTCKALLSIFDNRSASLPFACGQNLQLSS